MAYNHYFMKGEGSSIPPGDLLYISSASYGKDWLSVPHSHSFTEIFYVTGGEGFFCTEQRQIPIAKDSLIIINPNTRHTEKSSAKEPLTYIALGIDNACLKYDSEAEMPHHIFDFTLHRDSVLLVLNELLAEVRQQKEGYEEVCRHLFPILLMRIMRITGESLVFSGPVDISPECRELKEYIDSHYKDSVTLDELARISHLNKYYLSHIFSKAFGISPINYLLERRILHSKELLRNFDFTITQIAHLCGFSSANYFTQSFKKYTGLTPLSYRKKYS